MRKRAVMIMLSSMIEGGVNAAVGLLGYRERDGEREKRGGLMATELGKRGGEIKVRILENN